MCVRLSHSSQPHGLEPARLLCPWNSPGESTGRVAILFSRGSSQPRVKLGSPALQADPLLFEPSKKPKGRMPNSKVLHDLKAYFQVAANFLK